MPSSRPTNFRWLIIFLLFSITIINYIDRSSIAYAINVITPVFHLTAEQTGWIFGVFGIGYAVSVFFSGIITDHYGARLTLFVGVCLWVVSLLLTGLSMGLVSLLFFRILLGLAEGPNFPVLTRAIGDWLPSHQRAIALSYSLLAIPIALAIGGPIVSHLMIWLGWRGMFIVLALLSLVWLPLWWWLFRNHPQQSFHVNAKECELIQQGAGERSMEELTVVAKRGKKLWFYLLSNKTLLANYWAYFVFGYLMFFFMTWLPRYLNMTYHLTLSHIGWLSTLPWILAVIFTAVMGYFSDYLLARTKSLRISRSYLIALSQLSAGLCLIPMTFVHHFLTVEIFMAFALASSMSAGPIFYSVNIDLAKERSATALGIMDTGFALSAFLAPVITGWVVAMTGRFHSAWVLMMILALGSVLITLLFHQPDRAQKLADI